MFTDSLVSFQPNCMASTTPPSGLSTGSHQRPQDGENPGGSQDEQAAQSLWVVGLHHLDDPQQGLDPWPPQVAHVETLQVHQAGPAAEAQGRKRLGLQEDQENRHNDTRLGASLST